MMVYDVQNLVYCLALLPKAKGDVKLIVDGAENLVINKHNRNEMFQLARFRRRCVVVANWFPWSSHC